METGKKRNEKKNTRIVCIVEKNQFILAKLKYKKEIYLQKI